MSEPIKCESRISRVVVYARGAVVTRRVELPAGLPSEAVALYIDGVTPMAEPGSVRTQVDGERRVTGLQAPFVWPETEQADDLDEDAIRKKEREIRRVEMRATRVQFRITHLQTVNLSAELKPPKRHHEQPLVGIAERASVALAASDLVFELFTKLDTEQRELQRKLEELRGELGRLKARPRPARNNTDPTRRVVVSLAQGSSHLRALEISYNVRAARWWPAYAARLTNGGKNAEFAVEGFVAQQTMENWDGVELSLCTADMVSDLTLPELQSLRLGRKQPPRPTGFREPPEGLEAMFRNHDSAFGPPDGGVVYGAMPPEEEKVGAVMPKPAPPPAAAPAMRMEIAASMAYEGATDEEFDDDMMLADMAEIEEAPMRKERSRGAPAKAKKMSANDMEFGGGGAPGGMAAPADEPEPEAAGVNDTWLDYDNLLLGENDGYQRGRLRYEHPASVVSVDARIRDVQRTSNPTGASDPQSSRGMFDHQFDADGAVDVPSTGGTHRVRLLAKPAKSRMAFRCVPLEDERVFREVEIENPLNAPLLPGPVDVFMDGALLITSGVNAVDRGGTIRFGLGEEQRLRVARNVRAREESKGMFKGGTAMEHEVSFEAASSLAGDIELELIDRLPISDDKEIEVELVSSEPKADKYDQTERGSHVKGGLRWKLKIAAGATVKAKLVYRIGFDKDFELVGGNRRA
ncbi:MAG: DUF4139 domain-containing protein [Planctomycetes bacterium]|nr:DUF4139 domain-containing protein [Planctomycetota bacterium]